jgi:hypothetical protein
MLSPGNTMVARSDFSIDIQQLSSGFTITDDDARPFLQRHPLESVFE